MTDHREFIDGKLDEIVSTAGAHLEYMGDGIWFLEMMHADGTSTALQFISHDLRYEPSFEIRGNVVKVPEAKGDRDE